jgi:hypothetical protein
MRVLPEIPAWDHHVTKIIRDMIDDLYRYAHGLYKEVTKGVPLGVAGSWRPCSPGSRRDQRFLSRNEFNYTQKLTGHMTRNSSAVRLSGEFHGVCRQPRPMHGDSAENKRVETIFKDGQFFE